MYRKLLSALLLTVLFVPAVFAQTGSISGMVTDAETGDIIPTANILLVEINRGTATDTEGNYSIGNIPVGTYTMRVSFIGYKTYTNQILIEEGRQLIRNIELEPGAIGLDELVVTGYGVETKRELTGSITKVSSEDFQDVPGQNTESLLQGRAAGVQITTNSGAPGGQFEVKVRGTGSINAGTDPLFIVDGVQMSTSESSEQGELSVFNQIAPSDIESIEVLKDAAAAAIYGAQAANGVVLITTKRGQAGETQFTARSEWGLRSEIKTYDLLNTPQWVDYMSEAFANSDFGGDVELGRAFVLGNEPFKSFGIGLLGGFGYDLGTPVEDLRDFDWQDFIFRQGFSQKYNLSASGGTESTRFFITGGWERTEGSVLDSDFERFNLRTNFDHQFTPKLAGKLNFTVSNTQSNAVCEDGPFINCPVSQSNFEPPVSFPFLDDGSYNSNTRFGLSGNPAIVEDHVRRFADVVALLGNISATYNFNSWLSLTTLWGLDYRQTRDVNESSIFAAPSTDGFINEGIASVINFNTNTVLNFRQTFRDKHNISGLIGGEYRRDFSREIETTGQGLPNNLFTSISSTANPSFAQGFDDEFRIASYFGQAKYNFDERYFVSVTARYDGSSRFGRDNRWGFFPSVSAAWRASEEQFFNVDIIDDLKIRASYGVTGNAEIGNFAASPLFGISGSYSGVRGLSFVQLANPNLTWEEAKEINLGLDYSLWGGRFSGSIDIYQRDNENLLLDRPLPLDSSFNSVTSNVGEVRNQGIEFEFNSVNVDRGDFLWTSRFNIAIQKNEVLSLVGDVEQLGSGLTPVRIGKPIDAFWAPRWAGVNPADGRPMWLDANGNITYDPTIADNVFFDGAEQDVIGGFGSRFSYRGLSLDVFFQYSFGQHAFPAQEWFFMQTPTFVTGVWDEVLRRWQQPGDITDIPRVIFLDQFPNTANFRTTIGRNALFDASYIRLKNVTLSYNLPSSIVQKINLRGLRFYASGLNLITWTSWPGLDPEVAGTFTQASFPAALQVNGGVEIRF